MRESAQKPFKSIASHLLEHREVAEYEILIEVFVWFWYILKRENGKRRKSEALSPYNSYRGLCVDRESHVDVVVT